MSDSVELRPAFEWTCEACGRDNFARAVTYEGPPICVECHHAEDDHAGTGQGRSYLPCEHPGCDCGGFETSEDLAGEWLMKPARVVCTHCRTRFETQPEDDQG
jgi:hypothetical protein